MPQPILDAPVTLRSLPPRSVCPPLALFTERVRTPLKVAVLVAMVGVGTAVGAIFLPVLLGPTEHPIVRLFCLLAIVCAPLSTGMTVLAAHHAKSTARAIGLTFVGCVAPPAALFLITVYGLFFAVPAGLLAFCCVVPLVLAARRAERSAVDAVDSLLVGGAAWLATIGGVTLFLEHLIPNSGRWGVLPLLGALAAAVDVLLRDSARLALLSRTARGAVDGLALRTSTDADATFPRLGGGATGGRRTRVLEAVGLHSDGAFRTSRTRAPIGLVAAPWRRAALAALVVLFLVASLLVSRLT